MHTTIKNPEFVKRMVVDAENLSAIRKKFFSGETLTAQEIALAITIEPRHNDINWGPNRLTLIPWSAIEHLDHCIRDTVARGIPGDFMETGAWRGGACIIAKSIYDAVGSDKKVFVADSFEGLPKPDAERYPDDKNDTHYLDETLKVSLETVKENFKKFDCMDQCVIFLKGWFKDTMPTAPIDTLSILRLDGDMYESTIDVLKNMYHKLSVGGYCIIDDYHHRGCRQAISDFRSKNGITEMILKVDSNPLNEVHYWIKEKKTAYVEGTYPKKGFSRAFRIARDTASQLGKRVFRKAKRLLTLR